MTSDFPYYLALFGLVFFISVICCCIKLIDIIDRPISRPNNSMPGWNYANYLQNSPVAMLSPQPDPYLRCMALAENHGLTVEEYLTASAQGPGLYTSTSRDAISLQYGNHSINHNLPPPPPPAPAPSPNPSSPPGGLPCYSIPVPDQQSTNSLPRSYSRSSSQHHSSRPPRLQNRSSSLKERGYPPKYEDICFDV